MKDWDKFIDNKLKSVVQRSGKKVKTLDEVFDKRSLLAFYKLFTKGILDRVDFPISTGKEANIYKATTPKGKPVVVKVYRTSTSTFKHMWDYIEFDPRFKSVYSARQRIIYEWAKKEYSNLRRLWNAGVKVPKPIAYLNNMIVMEYIGDEQRPAPLLREVKLTNPLKVFEQITQDLVKAYNRAGLVHADLSAFNIMIDKGIPRIFDVGQAVVKDHPRAKEFLERDIKNLVSYFNKLGVPVSEASIYNRLGVKK
jgi:RIO kinase 1